MTSNHTTEPSEEDLLKSVIAQYRVDLTAAHAEICKLQGLDPAAHSWPEWSSPANTLRWFDEIEARALSPSNRMTAEEWAVVRQIGAEQELSDAAVLRQALRLYQMDHERRKAGETVTWSGDEQRARDFAGPLAISPSPDDRMGEADFRAGFRAASNVVDAEYQAEWQQRALEDESWTEYATTRLAASREGGEAKVLEGQIPPFLSAPSFDDRSEERVCINGCLYLRADFAATRFRAALGSVQDKETGDV